MSFPTSPADGQQATVNGIVYNYNGTKGAWIKNVTTAGTLTTGNLVITSNTASVNSTTGAVTVAGGVGVGGNIVAAGAVTVTGGVGVNTNTTTDALRITQTGTGNALVVEDSANPDSTPFVVDASGDVGIGTSLPTKKLHVVGDVLLEDGSPILTMKDNNATGSSYGGYIDFVDSTDVRQGYIGFGSTSNATLTIQSTDASGQINFSIGGASRATITSIGDLQFNSGYGSVATAYGCRAWVNFDGTGAVGAQTIRASGGVTSVSKSATGLYAVNLSTTLPDANYAAICTTQPNSYGGSYVGSGVGTAAGTNSTTAVYLEIRDTNNANSNSNTLMVAIFR